MSDTLLVNIVIIWTAAIVYMAVRADPAVLVCDEPDVIAVEETAHGVIVRCGPVEVQP